MVKAMAANAPVIREDLKDKTDGAHGKRKHANHIFNWQAGDKTATDAAFAKADVTIKELIVYPRCHPCPLETCQCVASFDKIKGELTLYGMDADTATLTKQGTVTLPANVQYAWPHPSKKYFYVASIVTGKPVKWVEDRIENLSTTAFARDFHKNGDGPQ